MLNRIFIGGVLRVASAALVLSLVAAPAAFAKGGPGKGDHADERRSIPDFSRHDRDSESSGSCNGEDKLSCPNSQVVVRTDEKFCPDKPNRPTIIRKRVCCQHGRNMTVSCRPFRPCPPRSCS